jgi:hypothetical protein
VDSNTFFAIALTLYLVWHIADNIRDVLLDRRSK